jgi:hypothetical protein
MYRATRRSLPAGTLIEAGLTDCGKPLHTFIISQSQQFDPAGTAAKGKPSIVINNGIHPGEPEGIDAARICRKYSA